MIYLNFNNLDDETQQRLIHGSKMDVENRFGEDIRAYAKQHHLDYETLLEEESIRNLYTYQYVFNI